jgi:RNA polymerase sigma-70 factor (sigma-E family)
MRLAYLLAGNQHAAEDLLQTALMKTAAHWSSLRHADPEGYVRTVLYREQISWWRRWGRRRESAVATPLEVPYADPSADTDLRLAMRRALLQLPPHQRAVLVLRYFEDRTESQVAEVLECSIGTVRSRTHRAITRLRAVMPEFADVTSTAGRNLP